MAIERLACDGTDPALNRVNALEFAARVQGLAQSRSIFATRPVVEHPAAAQLLAAAGLVPALQSANLRGITDAFAVYEIP